MATHRARAVWHLGLLAATLRPRLHLVPAPNSRLSAPVKGRPQHEDDDGGGGFLVDVIRPSSAEPPSSRTGLRQPETNPRGSIDSWPRAESFRREATRIPERDRRRCGSTRRYRCRRERHPAARVRWTGIAEQPAKAGQRHPPYGLDEGTEPLTRRRCGSSPGPWMVSRRSCWPEACRSRSRHSPHASGSICSCGNALAVPPPPPDHHEVRSRGTRCSSSSTSGIGEERLEPRRPRDRPSRIRHRSRDSPGALQRLRGRLERRPADGGHEVAVIARSEGLGPRADRRGPDR